MSINDPRGQSILVQSSAGWVSFFSILELDEILTRSFSRVDGKITITENLEKDARRVIQLINEHLAKHVSLDLQGDPEAQNYGKELERILSVLNRELSYRESRPQK